MAQQNYGIPNVQPMHDKSYRAAGRALSELSSIHQCVVYLRINRELGTKAIAGVLQITCKEVRRIENEARRRIQAVVERL